MKSPNKIKKPRVYKETYTLVVTRRLRRLNRTYRMKVDAVKLVERLAIRRKESMADCLFAGLLLLAKKKP